MSTPVSFRHLGVREGFEVAWYLQPTQVRGGSTYVENGAGHHIAYEIENFCGRQHICSDDSFS